MIHIVVLTAILTLTSCSHLLRNNDNAFWKEVSEKDTLRYLHKKDKHLEMCHGNKKKKGIDRLKSKAHKKNGDFHYWNNVGICYFLAKDYSKSLFYFHLSLEKSPSNFSSKVFNNIGVVHLHLTHYRQALTFFLKASKKKTQLTPNLNLAYLYTMFGHDKMAKDVLDNLRRHHGKNGELEDAIRNVAQWENK